MRKVLFFIVSITLLMPFGAFGQAVDSAPMTDDELASLSGSELSSLATSKLAQMESDLAASEEVAQQLQNSDRVNFSQLSCVNEKVQAIRAYLSVGEQAELSLETAIGENNGPEKVHQIKLVLLSSTRVQLLAEKTNTCLKDNVLSGKTQSTTTKRPSIRTDNPVNIETEDVTTEPLLDSSPYQ